MRCGCGECVYEWYTWFRCLSSTGDVRGVGVVCDMCMCLARGGVGGEGGEWMRELGLGFTNPVETGGVLDMCLCFGCGGVGLHGWHGQKIGPPLLGAGRFDTICTAARVRCNSSTACRLCRL